MSKKEKNEAWKITLYLHINVKVIRMYVTVIEGIDLYSVLGNVVQNLTEMKVGEELGGLKKRKGCVEQIFIKMKLGKKKK